MSNEEFEHHITNSLMGMKVFSQDIILDGLLSRPVRLLQEALDRMAPHFHVYQHAFRYRPCSPRIILQIQWATASYMLLDGLKAIKQIWTNPERLYHAVDEIEQQCLEQIRLCDWALSNATTTTTASIAREESSTARILLKYRFHAVIGRIYGIALLHIVVLRSRTSSGSFSEASEIKPKEANQLGAKLSDAMSNISDDVGLQIVTFLSRFGHPFPDRLLAVLGMFIECTDIKLDGVPFRAPFRDVVLDVLVFSRSIVENNSINVKSLYGKLKENAGQQASVIEECAKRLGNMVASCGPGGSSIEAAFAGGCVFAASTKVLRAFLDIMGDLKKESDLGKAGQGLLASAERPSMSSTFAENPPDSANLWSTELMPNSVSAENFALDWSAVMGFDDLDFEFGSS
jgi:hypothetical protein